MLSYVVIGICVILLLAVIFISAKPIRMGIEARREIKENSSLPDNKITEDQNLSDDEKNKQSQGCYNTGADINIRLAISYISEVTRGDQKETDLGAITEFVKSNDVEFFAQLKKKIQELVLKWNLPALDAVCGAEDCGKEYRAALDVDYANFFGTKFLHSRNLIS